MKVFKSTHVAPNLVQAIMSPEGRTAYSNQYERYVADVKEEARSFEPHDLAGEVVGVVVADGVAEYAITKVNGSVSLIWIEGPDGYRDSRFERLCTVRELRTMVAQNRRLAAACEARR